eukprot:4275785-Pleurochrysis_carterae.AAC.2
MAHCIKGLRERCQSFALLLKASFSFFWLHFTFNKTQLKLAMRRFRPVRCRSAEHGSRGLGYSCAVTGGSD